MERRGPARALVKAFVYPKYRPAICYGKPVSKGTELGRGAKAVMDSGKLVDDDTMLGMIRERLRHPDATRGFILEPRPKPRKTAKELGTPLDRGAVEFRSGHSVWSAHRRRICQDCGKVFNVYTSPPPEGKHRLLQRAGRQGRSHRQALGGVRSADQTADQVLRGGGPVAVVDADADVDAVFKSIEHAVFKR